MAAGDGVCGLARLGESEKKNRFVILDGRSELKVGRSPQSDLKFVSDMISRNHAIFKKKENNTWVVIDNKSLNGVMVNGERQVPYQECTLCDMDIIQLGVKPTPESQAEFVYRFHMRYSRAHLDNAGPSSPTDVNSNINKRKHSTENDSPDKKVRLNQKCTMSPSRDKLLRERLAEQEMIAKAKIEESERKLLEVQQRAEMERRSQEESLEEERKVAQQRIAEAEEKLSDMQRLAQQELEAQNRLKEAAKKLADLEKITKREKEAQERVQLAEQQLAEMQRTLKEKEKAEAEAKQELKEKEEKLQKELQLSHAQLEEEKHKLEKDMKEKLEEALKQKEDQLMNRLNREKADLQEARRQVEENLQKEMERKLEAKDKNLQEELIKQKEKLDKVIEKKELEQKMLESQLNETKAENVKEKEKALRVKDDVLTNFADLMETELQCAICNELFIQATSLNCSHSYCSYCIEEWMKKKKECPLCRKKITSHIRSIVLDTYIDAMLEHLSEDMKQNRKQMIEFRKKETEPRKSPRKKNKPETTANNVTTSSTSAPSTRGRMTTRSRGGRARRGRVNTATNPTPAAINVDANELIVIPDVDDEVVIGNESPISISDDDPDDSDDEDEYFRRLRYDDSDSSSSVEGDPGAYYGGYGECYRCGRRGHWANGCPDYYY